jgi:hypothetical protein
MTLLDALPERWQRRCKDANVDSQYADVALPPGGRLKRKRQPFGEGVVHESDRWVSMPDQHSPNIYRGAFQIKLQISNVSARAPSTAATFLRLPMQPPGTVKRFHCRAT